MYTPFTHVRAMIRLLTQYILEDWVLGVVSGLICVGMWRTMDDMNGLEDV